LVHDGLLGTKTFGGCLIQNGEVQLAARSLTRFQSLSDSREPWALKILPGPRGSHQAIDALNGFPPLSHAWIMSTEHRLRNVVMSSWGVFVFDYPRGRLERFSILFSPAPVNKYKDICLALHPCLLRHLSLSLPLFLSLYIHTHIYFFLINPS